MAARCLLKKPFMKPAAGGFPTISYMVPSEYLLSPAASLFGITKIAQRSSRFCNGTISGEKALRDDVWKKIKNKNMVHNSLMFF